MDTVGRFLVQTIVSCGGNSLTTRNVDISIDNAAVMRRHTDLSSLSGLSGNDLLARTSSAHRNKDFFTQLVTSCQSNNQSPSESCMWCWLQTDAPTPPVDPSSDENSPRSVPRADLSVGLGGAGGDGAAEEGAHRGPEGDEEAAGKIVLPRALPSAPSHFLSAAFVHTVVALIATCAFYSVD